MNELIKLSVIVLFLLISAAAEDEFSCHPNFLTAIHNERAAIYPRADINLEVGGNVATVLCRFNKGFIKPEDVYFQGINNIVLPHKVVNSSTIQTKISHPSEAAKYPLKCVLKRPKSDKVLCQQYVKAGHPPLDIVKDSLHCVSKNYAKLNCTWKYQDNPIDTMWTPQYSVPTFTVEKSCLTNDAKTMCYFQDILSLRNKLVLHFHGNNTLGFREYSYTVNIAEVVIPDKIPVQALLTGPKTVKIAWNLSYPIDVFFSGLWHKVDYRLAGDKSWETMKLLSHKHPLRQMRAKRDFHVTKELPLANMQYEFRVRLHTMAAPIENVQLWSDYNVISLFTEAMLPATSPRTDLSSFEVVEYLDQRDIYVNFQDVDQKLYNGDKFKYKVLAYSASSIKSLHIKPTDQWRAYVKYPMMDFNETIFKIWPENEKGVGEVFSEVIVPSYVCMPKKTDFFTVIIRDGNDSKQGSKGSKVFSLYWVPSKRAEEQCPNGSVDIDFYTVFWCKKTYAERCQEKLFWTDVKDLRSISHQFSAISGTNSTLYEKNITGLSEGLYTFGVAAISGKYSSGIRWSRCIVDEFDSPPAPSNVNAYAEDSNTVRLKWELKCPSLSAVPLGFKIVYCKSEIPDFGHCTSRVESIIVNKPDAKGYTINKGLLPGVSYIFSVSLLSYIGEGKQSAPVKYKIGEKRPTGAPISFRVEEVGNSSATLSWLQPNQLLRNGKIDKFCLYPLDIFGRHNCIQAGDKTPYMYTMENLSAFTSYTIGIVACNKAGCSDFKSKFTFVTKPGLPEPVRNFALDVSNWRLQWEAGLCNSEKCTYDVKILVNDTFTIEETVEDINYLSLYELEFPCLNQEITFLVRPIGISEDKRTSLYGEWTSTTKTADECPPVTPPLWVISLIVSIGILIAAFVLIVFKFGWRSVMKAIKACTMKIDVPKGILEDTIKDKKNDHKKDKKYLKDRHDSLLKGPKKNPTIILPVYPPENISQDDKAWARSPRTSVSSEEIQLIPSNGDRQGRNLSDSSESSSNQDSAVMSQSSSTGGPDSPLAQNCLPQRISDFTYVQHGMMPDQIPAEGYVAARSVPSLPSLLKSGDTDILQSTPNLNSTESAIVMGMNGARRASTGYISMVNSDTGKVSPSQIEAVVFEPNSLLIPPYTQHGVYPTQEMNHTVPAYVTLAQAPAMFCSTNGYVPAEAYCKVAEREIPRKEKKITTNPYVAVGDHDFMFGHQQNIPAYVQLSDANRWTAPVPEKNLPPEKLNHGKNLINQMTPSLSKQSSGYVSQEALVQENQSDQVVVSPKRLVNQRPQSIVVPVSSQKSSMV